MSELAVSEHFFSIQGEGKTAGTPALFLRLRACNLLCAWPCDTIDVWRQGDIWRYEKILKHWEANGWLHRLRQGAHLVVTGGEPLLQQERLAEFLELLPNNLFIEVETNATIPPLPNLDRFISLYNASPKTSNSGMAPEKRHVHDAVWFFAHSMKGIFKFVVESKADVEEVRSEYLNPYGINPRRVYLMPQSGTRKEFLEKSETVTQLCKEYGYNFSPRLQLVIWDKATGV